MARILANKFKWITGGPRKVTGQKWSSSWGVYSSIGAKTRHYKWKCPQFGSCKWVSEDRPLMSLYLDKASWGYKLVWDPWNCPGSYTKDHVTKVAANTWKVSHVFDWDYGIQWRITEFGRVHF